MQTAATFDLSSTILAALFTALGVLCKSLWDSYAGFLDKTRLERWKIDVAQKERQLSEFFWPLYFHLMKDDKIWDNVFLDLRPRGDRVAPTWIKNVPNGKRLELSREIETKVLIPNHVAAVEIIASKMHLACAEQQLEDLLLKYVRHVEIYRALKSVGLNDVDPADAGEPYPVGLTEAVKKQLLEHQRVYDQLIQDDLARDASPAWPAGLGLKAKGK
jgi:hypothetical protein